MRTGERSGGTGSEEEAITASSSSGDGGGSSRKGGWGWVGKFHRDLLAGALMGGMVHTVVAPIERAKLLLQTQEGNAAILGFAGRPRKDRFRGMFDCIFRTVREEGVLSLWRGNGTVASLEDCTVFVVQAHSTLYLRVLDDVPQPVVTSNSFKALLGLARPMSRDLYRAMLRGEASQENAMTSAATANFLAGASAGCTTLILIYPLDIAHTRLAADIGRSDSRQFRGIYHFLRTIHQTDGIRGIYRGLPASLHGMVVHRGLYFGGFDTAKEFLVSEDSALWKRWVTAQLVTTTAGLVSYPLDTVRRRMMMQSGMERKIYSSTADCWRKIYKMEGFVSFYRGAVSNMFRGTGAAAILVLYDEVKKFMNWGGF